MIEVVVLHWNGPYSVKMVKLGELGREVGGYVELLPHPDPSWTGYCNEEGRLRNMPENVWSQFLREQGFLIAGNICGDVVLCDTDENGEEMSISEQRKLAVQAYSNEHFAGGDDDSSSSL